MKLLVTGGAGFFGYHLCNQLAEKFAEIAVVDIADYVPDEYPKNAIYHKCDIRDSVKLKTLFAGYDIVVHSAAAMPLWKKSDILSTNIHGTKNVLEACVSNGIKRMVYISSASVYGVEEQEYVTEEFIPNDMDLYAATKLEAERLCSEYRSRGLCIPILRAKTFIGTGRLGVFQILYDWVKSGVNIPLIGDGRNKFQLLEVSDLIDAVYLMITLPESKVNDTFNIAGEEFQDVYTDVKELCDYAGSGSKPMPIPVALAVPALEVLWALRLSPLYRWLFHGAYKNSIISIDRIKNATGWKPKYSNAQALIRSYSWYMENSNKVSSAGVSHRSAWKQGILSLVKRAVSLSR